MQRSRPTILVESRTLLREGLASILHGSMFTVIANVATPAELSPATLGRAGLVIVGVCGLSPRPMDWIERVSPTTRNYKIVAVAECNGLNAGPDISRVLQCGADAYVVNIRSRDVLLRSLDLAFLKQKIVVLGEIGPALSAPGASRSAIVENAQRRSRKDRAIERLSS